MGNPEDLVRNYKFDQNSDKGIDPGFERDVPKPYRKEREREEEKRQKTIAELEAIIKTLDVGKETASVLVDASDIDRWYPGPSFNPGPVYFNKAAQLLVYTRHDENGYKTTFKMSARLIEGKYKLNLISKSIPMKGV